MEKLEINILPKFIDIAASPVAKSVGETLSSIWDIVFGGIDSYAEKKQFERSILLDQFKTELESKVSAIPDDKLQEPQLHIVGPSIEASKYYFENKVLRNMFSNLIASSLNSDTLNKAHPSFVEIIKQLSPLDAKNLNTFKDNSNQPIVEYRSIFNDDSKYNIVKTNIFLENNCVADIDLIASSISNLLRLGLASVIYGESLIDTSLYEKYNNHPFFIKTRKNLLELKSKHPEFKDLIVKKGIITITPFGADFISACL